MHHTHVERIWRQKGLKVPQNLRFAESGVQRDGNNAPELGRVVFVLFDLLQPALVRLQLDGEEFFLRPHALPVGHVGQFNPLQPVLVQLVEGLGR